MSSERYLATVDWTVLSDSSNKSCPYKNIVIFRSFWERATCYLETHICFPPFCFSLPYALESFINMAFVSIKYYLNPTTNCLISPVPCHPMDPLSSYLGEPN